MIKITDLGYLISQNVQPESITGNEKMIVYYEDTDMIPAKAFQWLSKLRDSIQMVPYSDIGGRDNLSFAAGICAAGNPDKKAVIIGGYDEEERIINMDGNRYSILTTPSFGNAAKPRPVQKDNIKTSTGEDGLPETVGRIRNLIPPESLPYGMSIEEFAMILDGAISHVKKDRKRISQYIKDTAGRDLTASLKSLYESGAYDKIENVILGE